MKSFFALKKTRWILLGLIVVVLGIVGYYAYSAFHFAKEIQSKPETSRFKDITKNNPENEPPKWEGTERVNILLLGGDSRGLNENEIPRSDSLLVASIDPVTKRAYLFSILRDTYVSIPDYGDDRINASVALGGPQLAMKTVGELLNIPIQYYVYTDFKGFIALIDAIGGIDFEVEKDMKYSSAADGREFDIDLKKGLQHLDGRTALQYVRFRHDAMSDYSRTDRQRRFLQEVAKELQSTSSIIKLPKILNSMIPYIETNLSLTDMIKLARLGYESNINGIVSEQLPPFDLLKEESIGGASVITVDKERLQMFVEEKLNQPIPTETPDETTDAAPDATSDVIMDVATTTATYGQESTH